MKKNIIILTSDPYSINYEIIKKSLFFFKKKNRNNYIFIGCENDLMKKLNLNINILKFINIKKTNNTKTYLRNCFESAFNLLKNKEASAIVNLPLNKKFLPDKYPGFTEYISDYFNKKKQTTMLLFNQNFSVCPNTTHMPLKHVSSSLSRKIIKKNFQNINNFYQKVIGIKNPKIAIAGLNPHNGIDFNFKTEEDKIIIPAIKNVKIKNAEIFGPFSPDTAFHKVIKNQINCLVGNYHDQVLPTFKYINNFDAINITLGLPFLRISPDHGTATDIIGKNLAKPDSFLYALNFLEKYYKTI